MIIYLFCIIGILLLIILIQYKANTQRNKNLRYIEETLKRISQNETTERLLIFTDDQWIIGVLKEINELLDSKQKCTVGYSKTEMSMKKMLSNISHDLKTPLTVILGYLETIKLEQTMGETEKLELLDKVEAKSKELLELINKFFNLAKLESEDKEIPLTRVFMNEVCRRNILAYFDILSKEGFQVEIEISEERIFAYGNEEALDRILNNLISNAVKYGKDGNILGLALSADEKFVFVEVWDKGKGIEEQDMDRVFERLFTLEDSRNKDYDGSGLGLTITKRLVEKLSGEIILTSKANEKTSFCVKLRRSTY